MLMQRAASLSHLMSWRSTPASSPAGQNSSVIVLPGQRNSESDFPQSRLRMAVRIDRFMKPQTPGRNWLRCPAQNYRKGG
jgi:hypothetical protein